METLSETLLSNPAWSGLRAVREGRFYTLEHELYNLKPNARWGEAYEKARRHTLRIGRACSRCWPRCSPPRRRSRWPSGRSACR